MKKICKVNSETKVQFKDFYVLTFHTKFLILYQEQK